MVLAWLSWNYSSQNPLPWIICVKVRKRGACMRYGSREIDVNQQPFYGRRTQRDWHIPTCPHSPPYWETGKGGGEFRMSLLSAPHQVQALPPKYKPWSLRGIPLRVSTWTAGSLASHTGTCPPVPGGLVSDFSLIFRCLRIQTLNSPDSTTIVGSSHVLFAIPEVITASSI